MWKRWTQSEDCPSRDGKQVTPNVLKDDAQTTRCFYALRTRRDKQDKGDDYDGKLLYFFSVINSF